MPTKLYKSKAWLTLQYKKKARKPADIAKDCGCTEQTIWNHLKQFGLT